MANENPLPPCPPCGGEMKEYEYNTCSCDSDYFSTVDCQNSPCGLCVLGDADNWRDLVKNADKNRREREKREGKNDWHFENSEDYDFCF